MALSSSAQKFVLSRWPWLAASLFLTVSLFVSTTVGWFWYVDQRDSAARILALDLLWLEQTVTQSLDDNQRMMEIWARDLQHPTPKAIGEFLKLSDGMMNENQAVIAIDYLDRNGKRVAGLPAYSERPQKLPPLTDPYIIDAMQHCLAMKKPVYSRVIEQYAPLWVLALPVSDEFPNDGVVLITYDLDQLLSLQVPWWFVQRYDLKLMDRDNKQLSPRDGNPMGPDRDIHKLNFGPANSGLSLHAAPHSTGQSQKPLILLAIAVLTFGLLIVWLLRLLQRWLRERLEAQRALQHELRFREAMEQSLVTGLIAFDTEGKIIYVNRALCTMLGVSADKLIGAKAPFVFWPIDHFAECAAAHAAMLRGDNPETGRRLNLQSARSEQLSVRLFASPLVSDVSNGWMVSLYDTTELQKEREALALSREQLYTVLSGLDAMVFVSRISDAQLLFRNKHEAPLSQFQPDAACCLLPWAGVPRSPNLNAIDFQNNGRWYHLQRRSIMWVDNTLAQLDIATDISSEHQAKETARQRDELLNHTARLSNLAEFASGIAHELNQPLAAISNYSAVACSYLETTPLNIEKVIGVIGLVGVESNRAGKIIHSMRNFIQKRAIEHQRHNLLDLVPQPLLLLETMSQRLELGVVVDADAGPITVDCDPVMIEQVLLNLIRNGLEAAATIHQKPLKDAVTIRIRREAGHALVCVADRGPGLGNPEKLFQPFYTTKPDGMGLGLAICRTVIESHGGKLWAETNHAGGASFYFKLQCSTH